MYGTAAVPSTITCQRGSKVAFSTTAAVRLVAVTSPAKKPFCAWTRTSVPVPAGVTGGRALMGSVGASGTVHFVVCDHGQLERERPASAGRAASATPCRCGPDLLDDTGGVDHLDVAGGSHQPQPVPSARGKQGGRNRGWHPARHEDVADVVELVLRRIVLVEIRFVVGRAIRGCAARTRPRRRCGPRDIRTPAPARSRTAAPSSPATRRTRVHRHGH